MLSSLVNRSKVSPFATKSLIHGNKYFSLFSVNIFRSLFRYISVSSYIGNNVVYSYDGNFHVSTTLASAAEERDRLEALVYARYGRELMG